MRYFLLDQQGGRPTLLQHVTVTGPVDPDRLAAAARAVCAAQPALRTSLHLTDQGLVQSVHPAAEVDITAERTADEASVLAERTAEARAPFEHGAGPLCRIRIVATPERAHCLVGVHHAVFDEDSAAILLRHLALAYHEGPSALPPAPAPRPEPGPDRVAALNAFWSARLDGCPRDTALTVTGPGGPAGHGIVELPLPAELSAGMRRLARETGTTPFAQVLAAVAVVTAWYGDTEDVVLATVAANRTEQDGESIGCLQNTLPVRVRLDGADTESVLDRTADALYDCVEHADLPIESILALIGAARRPGRKPLTQVICTQGTAPEPLTVDGVHWRLTPPAPTEAEYDLAVTLHRSPTDGLTLAVEYQRAVLPGPAARLLADQLTRALAALVTEPPVPLAELALYTAAELPRRREGNRPATAFATTAQRVAEHARRTPTAPALLAGPEQLDYAALDRRVDGLAGALVAAGVRPGDRVAVCLPRTADLVVAMLAVWRAGAAYLPLDPGYPSGRLRLTVEDAGPAALVRTPGTGPELATAGLPVLAPDASAPAPAEGWPAVRPSDPAYVIHTSGTTGRPKGVVIRHENLAALFAAFDGLLPDAPAVTVAATSVSFDISALELHWPLHAGRTVLLTDHRSVADRPVPQGALYQCTPTMARILVGDPAGRRLLGRLGTLLVGGEPLPQDLAGELALLVPGPVFNCYGPTESTVWSTAWRVSPEVPVHIGHPLAGEDCRIVDAHGRLLPPGVPGRLLVLGDGVGSGYWRQPELTAARFGRYEGRPGYDTGDVAVLDPEHGLRFVGRADTQVKILGQRIELAEIESVLRAHPAVRDAVVTVTADGTAVTACLVPAEPLDGPGAGPAPAPAALAEELRRHAADSLVPAMVPAGWLVAGALPQLPNGKLDRAAVARWAADAPGRTPTAPPVGGQPGGPAPAAADLVRRTWEHVLGTAVTSLDTGFFELGGTSSGLLRVLALLQQEHPDLTAADLFRHTTVRALTARLAPHPTPGDPAAPGTTGTTGTTGAPGTPPTARGAARAKALGGWRRPERAR